MQQQLRLGFSLWKGALQKNDWIGGPCFGWSFHWDLKEKTPEDGKTNAKHDKQGLIPRKLLQLLNEGEKCVK